MCVSECALWLEQHKRSAGTGREVITMETTTAPPKLKIWEIDSCYKCALIGTCLSRAELRKLSQEKVYHTPPQLDDYQLHVHFIKISDQESPAGKALHKYLEKKYRAQSKKYLRIETQADMIATWESDLAASRVDSAWWNVLTHPAGSVEVVARCYGQLHMLSHDCTNSAHRDRQRLANLQAKCAMLEEVVGSERQYFRQEKRKLVQENREWQTKAGEGLRHAEEHRRQQTEMAQLREQIKTMEDGGRNAEDQQILNELRQSNNSLCGRIDGLMDEIDQLRQELARAASQLGELQQVRQQIERREAEQAREIISLESLLFRHIAAEQDPCTQCADQNSDNCPGSKLCGKTVLYVGGLHKMVPHYRQLVEQFGGRFLHHDGGKEASRNLLPKLLSTADAVLCPIDCVSHDACICVKKICKRSQKPLVFMRSSGLSSLARGLTEIVQ